MPNFKDFVRNDMKTFVNAEEFADMHNVDGREIHAVIEATDEENPLAYAEGLSIVRKTAYFDAADLWFVPVQGMKIKIDGVRYDVQKVSDEMGAYVVSLEANMD